MLFRKNRRHVRVDTCRHFVAGHVGACGHGAGKKQGAQAAASKGKGKSRGARVREAKKRNQESESETSSRQLRGLLR